MQRPAGVIVIAVLDFIGGAVCVLFGLLSFVGGSFIAGLFAAANAGAGSGLAAGIGAIIGVVFLGFAALAVITGIGLLKLKGWGRILEIILALLGLLGAARGIAGGALHTGGSSLVIMIVEIAYLIWVVWYMFTPGVKAAFSGQQSA
jgi:hypothetical protein